MREQRDITKPQAGFWMIQLVKNGPFVPACIKRVHTQYEPEAPLNKMPERSPFMAAEIAGEPCAIDDVWLRRGRPISEEEYRFQCRDAAWARENAPEDPKARPKEAINLMTTKPIF